MTPYDPLPRPDGPMLPDYSVGNAIGYGWRKFRANVGPWVGLVLLLGAVFVAATVVITVAGGGLDGGETDAGLGSLLRPALDLPTVLADFATGVVGTWVSAVGARAALAEVEGRRARIRDAFRLASPGELLLLSILCSVATTIGFALFVIPGVVLSVVLMFAVTFQVDRDDTAWGAMRASVSLVGANAGTVVLFVLGSAAVAFVGACACGVGLLVAIPVLSIAAAFTYRVLQDAPIAP